MQSIAKCFGCGAQPQHGSIFLTLDDHRTRNRFTLCAACFRQGGYGEEAPPPKDPHGRELCRTNRK